MHRTKLELKEMPQLRFGNPMKNFAVNSVVGRKGFYGCDFVEVVSIIVKGFVNVKSMNPNDDGKIFKVRIDNVEFV